MIIISSIYKATLFNDVDGHCNKGVFNDNIFYTTSDSCWYDKKNIL